MSKLENKTIPTNTPVDGFISSIDDSKRQADTQQVYQWICEITGISAKMWGKTIIGFGKYHYKYDSGREGDHFKIGLSPRKANLTIYIVPGFNHYTDLLAKLGKHKTTVSCLYIKKLEDVNVDVLKEIMRKSYEFMSEKYG